MIASWAVALLVATGGLRRYDSSCMQRALGVAALTDDITPGVVALPTGAWYGDAGENVDPHGNPNVLTPDIGTSKLGQGSSAHTALVQVSLNEG